MPRSLAFSVTFILCSATLLIAAPAAKDPPTTPITAANASRVQVAQEVPSEANRIVRGPNRGELILLDWGNTADVVDEMTLRTLRPFSRTASLSMLPWEWESGQHSLDILSKDCVPFSIFSLLPPNRARAMMAI